MYIYTYFVVYTCLRISHLCRYIYLHLYIHSPLCLPVLSKELVWMIGTSPLLQHLPAHISTQSLQFTRDLPWETWKIWPLHVWYIDDAATLKVSRLYTIFTWKQANVQHGCITRACYILHFRTWETKDKWQCKPIEIDEDKPWDVGCLQQAASGTRLWESYPPSKASGFSNKALLKHQSLSAQNGCVSR